MFFGKEHIYATDGMHLSLKGAEVLSDSLEHTLNFPHDSLGSRWEKSLLGEPCRSVHKQAAAN